jgi:hypothetical protein
MKTTVVFLAALLLTGACHAQSDEKKSSWESKFYRLDFVLKELEAGKVISTRTYTMKIADGPPFNGSSSVRMGDKIPVPAGGSNSAFTYVDVGVSIDCRMLKATDGYITVQVTADVSSVVGAGSVPLISQTKWGGAAIVPLRKPTLLFSADGATTTKRQMQLEITATPIQ